MSTTRTSRHKIIVGAILLIVILLAMGVWGWQQLDKAERFTIGAYSFDLDPLFARQARGLKMSSVEIGRPLFESRTPLPEMLRQTEGIELGPDAEVPSPALALDAQFLDWRGRLPGAVDLTARHGVDFRLEKLPQLDLEKFAGDPTESLETVYIGYANGAPDVVINCRNPNDDAWTVCRYWRTWKPGLNYSVRFEGGVEQWADIDRNVTAFLADAFVD